MDADGNDNSPEWGLCHADGCMEPAEPLWFSGGFPDEPDLLLCHDHIGRRVGQLLEEQKQAAAREAGLSLAADQYSESRDLWKSSYSDLLYSLKLWMVGWRDELEADARAQIEAVIKKHERGDVMAL